MTPDRFTTPHPEDVEVRRLLAQIEAFAAFDYPVSTEDILDRYLADVTA
jgi:hypothetical protein